MKIKKLVSSELKMYIINPNEFTQMIKKQSLPERSQKKKKRTTKEDIEQEKTSEII